VRIINIDEDVYNINLRLLHDTIFSPATSGDTVRLVISGSATIGSLSVNDPALDIGLWPDGVTLEIDGTGYIQGKGGDGRNYPGSVSGSEGGCALYTRESVDIIGDPKIYGGGGAGGGIRIRKGFTSGGDPIWVQAPGGGGAGSIPGIPGGTKLTGGVPGTLGGVVIGNGGAPGEDGLDASSGPGHGGSAGAGIDGVSYVTIVGSPDILGPQIN